MAEMTKIRKTPTGKPYRIIGLTGGIASGKSEVARILRELGYPTLDADQLARELSQPGGEAHPLILEKFGTDSRKKLREIIFGNLQARQELEAILHPLIVRLSREKAEALAEASPRKNPVIFYEATLLVETGRYKDLDGLMTVVCPEEMRVERLMQRDGIPKNLALRILAAQTDDTARCQAADHLLLNDGTSEELKGVVERAIEALDLARDE